METIHHQGTVAGEHPQNGEFASMGGPARAMRSVIDLLAWGKAHHYYRNLCQYLPDAVHFGKRETISDLELSSHFERLGICDSDCFAEGESVRAVPKSSELRRVNQMLVQGLDCGRIVLWALVAEIGGIRDGCISKNENGDVCIKREFANYGKEMQDRLVANFERALAGGRIALEYDANYETVEKKTAAMLIGEYPLLVRQFADVGSRLIDCLGPDGDAERRLFSTGIELMSSLNPKHVAFSAKLDAMLTKGNNA